MLQPTRVNVSKPHAELNLAVVTSIRTLDFERDQMDVAVRWTPAGQDWKATICFRRHTAGLHPGVADRLQATT
jgi:hypothetical protein